MANIMASATRLACAVVGALCLQDARASIDSAPDASGYNPLPAGYSLSYDRDLWTEEFSVFHLAVAEPVGEIGSGFAASVDPRLKPLTRLDSGWNLMTPWAALPMRVGDSVSSAGLWNQPLRLGGLQIGTLQPALPDVVAPPSLIVDPYQSPGPVALATPRFIDHLRSTIGFDAPSLAAAGRSDFSVESGRLRENFETRSDDYGSWVTSGRYRYGVSDGTTVDGHVAQVAGQQSYVGVGIVEGVGSSGLLSAQMASSRDQDANGWRAQLGADFARDRFAFAVRSHIQSAAYQDVGDPASSETLRQRTLASAQVDLGTLGRMSVASATQTYLDDSHRDIVALSHAVPFGGGGVVSTSAAYSPGQYGGSALWLSFTYPFAAGKTAAPRLDGTLNAGLDRTIVDAFGQNRPTGTVHAPGDRVSGGP